MASTSSPKLPSESKAASVAEAQSSRPVAWWTLDAWRVYTTRPCLQMLFLGFSAGLPLLLVFGTLSFWLREAEIDRTTIGFLSWVGLAYGFKWMWAPLVDRWRLPILGAHFGQRRSWLLLSQLFVILGLCGLGFSDPQQNLSQTVWFALIVAFASATQDISLDAFRIESAKADAQAALSATYQAGYRLGMIVAGAGALSVAAWVAKVSDSGVGSDSYQVIAWQVAYFAMAVFMSVGCVTVLLAKEPIKRPLSPFPGMERWIKEAAIEPFVDFIRRYGRVALIILALISVYRISDVVMGIMANPFYVDMGYSKLEVASVSKLYGVIMTIAGAFIGGLMSLRFGVMRILMLGAILSAASNLLFAFLAGWGAPNIGLLTVVISADNLSAGIATAAFIGYLSSLTNVEYSATQYALFSSVMLFLPKFVAGFSGKFVDAYGYSEFFIGTALLGLPVLLLIWLAGRYSKKAPTPRSMPEAASGSV